MLYGGSQEAALELRASEGGRAIWGRFPYNELAVLSDGGADGYPRKEQFAPGCFAYSLDMSAGNDIHLLFGHDFDKPLASKNNGTLTFHDTAAALTFNAIVAPEVAETSHAKDVFALIASGLTVGLSPGFRIPPRRAVPADKSERIEKEAIDPARGMHGAIIRTILAAILYELSIVTRPAYDKAQVEARSWDVTDSGLAVPKRPALARWRL